MKCARCEREATVMIGDYGYCYQCGDCGNYELVVEKLKSEINSIMTSNGYSSKNICSELYALEILGRTKPQLFKELVETLENYYKVDPKKIILGEDLSPFNE